MSSKADPHFHDQPLTREGDGATRFLPNRIVRHLLDSGPIDLNQIARLVHMKSFEVWEMEQLYQLIGYSVSGFCEISDFSDAAKDRVWEAADSPDMKGGD